MEKILPPHNSQGSIRLNEDILKNFVYVTELSEFYALAGRLNWQDRINLIDQAIILLTQTYVHLPLKRAMHGANPVELLQILKRELTEQQLELTEVEFHKAIINIFNSVRDLHTSYNLPSPYAERVAFLPLIIETCFEGDEQHFIVAKLFTPEVPEAFVIGSKITHWNNIPIRKAIEINADRFSGSNEAAHFARGVNAMTFRPLRVMLPPDEEQVLLHYIDESERRRHVTLPWLLGSRVDDRPGNADADDAEINVAQTVQGYDAISQEVNLIRKYFIVPNIASDERKRNYRPLILEKADTLHDTSFPAHFNAKLIDKDDKQFGYIRIYSFNTNSAEDFTKEFKRLIELLSKNTQGIILDVRSNGGGNIIASESMLQVLSQNNVKPQTAQFIITPLVDAICQRHSPSLSLRGLDLSPWNKFLSSLRQTGATYSQARAITSIDVMREFKSEQDYNLLLITDALCYSATDIFASGFKDNKLGNILGIDANTGAGGANVWTHRLFYHLLADENNRSPLRPLPHGANFTIAVRRTLRVNEYAGIPLEDLGVKPDHLHRMTQDDVLSNNKDLIDRACKLLQSTASDDVETLEA